MPAIVMAMIYAAVCCSANVADTTTVAPRSPSTAVLYSFVFPGMGQYYNESYWKVPIFAGAAVTSGYFIVANQSSFSAAAQEYDAAIASGQSAGLTSTLLRRREFYRNNRDVAGLALLLTYALAAVDAYVGANLHDFNVDPTLSMSLSPTPTSPLALNLQVRF